jgi:4-methyl-5(b-hydroxyethyl)-thiazole monophosphate biosynthesis
MSRVLLALAEGFEEIEAVTVIDVLRRAGVEVCAASLGGRRVTGSHGITLEADATLDEALAGDFDMIVLPGGMPGAANLKSDARVIASLAEFAAAGKYTAAICAAPGVLAHAGVLAGRVATGFPGFLDAHSAPGIRVVPDAVVTDGKVVTSRSAGTAMEFALELVELLEGRGARVEVDGKLLRKGDRG